MNRTARVLLPIAVTAALVAPLGVTAHAATGTATPATKSAAAYSRDTTIARAKTWLTANHGHQVPYSQSATWGGYRTDCSGYVSMALSLPKPGPNTVGLTSSTYTRRIAMASLVKGDLVIDAVGSSTTRHVVIFERWTSSAHRSYVAYEQRGSHGTDHRTLTYGLGSDQFDAYRPQKY